MERVAVERVAVEVERQTYLRFGDLPASGRSRLSGLFPGLEEAGVSVFRGRRRSEHVYEVDQSGGALRWMMVALLLQSRPAFFVTGTEIAAGSCGEPVLADCRVLEPVPATCAVLPNPPESLPALERWNAGRRSRPQNVAERLMEESLSLERQAESLEAFAAKLRTK